MSALTTMGGRIGRHAAIYGSGSLLTLAFGLLNVAVLTRFMDTSEFGLLAVFLVFAALLTVLYSAGSLQGSFSWVFGSTGEEEIAADGPPKGASDKRRALGSALVLTTLIAAAGTALIVLLAPQVSYLVIGSEERSDLVLWAAVSGGLGSVWRLASNVLRLERRPAAYVGLAATRPVFVLATSIPLVASGGGAEGALAGVAIGTAVSLLATMIAVRRNFRIALDRADVANILRLGGPWIPTVIALWVSHNADVFMLAQYLPESDVGVYRVASRVGAVMSYLVSAFLMAWGPLSVAPIAAAVDRERGLREAGATLTTYFALASMAALLGLAAFSDVLVRIAPPEYADAAPLIPLVGLGFVLYGGFVVVYRTAGIPNGRRIYIAATVFSALVLIGAGIALIPPLGTYGAALAVSIGPAAGMAVILAISRRVEDPVPFDARRILAGLVLAALCLAVAKAGGALGDPFGPIAEVLAWLAFPVLLLLTGVVPRDHLPKLRDVLESAGGSRRARRRIAHELDTLDEGERAELELLLQTRRAEDVATVVGKSVPEVLVDLVGALRKVGAIGEPSPADARIGEYLLSTASAADRNDMARSLWTSEVDPLELDALTLTLQTLARNHRKGRRGAGRRSAGDFEAAGSGRARDGAAR